MRGLYAIVDPAACRDLSPGLGPIHVARAVLRGGCAALQLRDKTSTDAEFTKLGAELAKLCREAGVPFIVNDRIWLAAELHAYGVHVGQTDAPLEEVRQLLGPACSIGLSTNTLAQALDAQRRGADVIGVGPVFATTTKLDTEPVVGLSGLAEVCAAVTIPVIAIGGVTLERAEAIARSGAQMAAAISALCAAPDPEQAARALHAKLS
jgi:thiamine-phosphate pyrophosphorylase